MPPAARISDMHTCPMVNPGTPPPPHVGGPVTGPGVPTVLIGNMPAATMGDMATCAGPPDSIIKGSPTVLIGSKPAARVGDNTAHGGVIMPPGCPTVLIGEVGMGGPQAGTMKLAKKSGAAFVEECPLKAAARAAAAGAKPTPVAQDAGPGQRSQGGTGDVKAGKAVDLLLKSPRLARAAQAAYHSAGRGTKALGPAVAKAMGRGWNMSHGKLHAIGGAADMIGKAMSAAAVGTKMFQAGKKHEHLARGGVADQAKFAGAVGYAGARETTVQVAGKKGAVKGAVAGAKLGAKIGLIGGPKGVVAGAAIGAVVGGIGGYIGAKKAADKTISTGEKAAKSRWNNARR